MVSLYLHKINMPWTSNKVVELIKSTKIHIALKKYMQKYMVTTENHKINPPPTF